MIRLITRNSLNSGTGCAVRLITRSSLTVLMNVVICALVNMNRLDEASSFHPLSANFYVSLGRVHLGHLEPERRQHRAKPPLLHSSQAAGACTCLSHATWLAIQRWFSARARNLRVPVACIHLHGAAARCNFVSAQRAPRRALLLPSAQAAPKPQNIASPLLPLADRSFLPFAVQACTVASADFECGRHSRQKVLARWRE